MLRVRKGFIEKGLPIARILDYLNQYLTPERRLPATTYGLLQIYRWFNPSSNGWAEPSGEIVLAVLEMERALS